MSRDTNSLAYIMELYESLTMMEYIEPFTSEEVKKKTRR